MGISLRQIPRREKKTPMAPPIKDRRTQTSVFEQEGGQEMTCTDQVMMGAMSGFFVGSGIGLLVGTVASVSLYRNGQPWIGFFTRSVITSAASFSLFLGIGASLRCEDDFDLDELVYASSNTTGSPSDFFRKSSIIRQDTSLNEGKVLADF